MHGHGHAPIILTIAHHHPPPGDQRYTIAIVLNLGFVLVEAGAGFFANSTRAAFRRRAQSSDVLGLALAGGAAWLAKQQSSEQRTYGFAKATVLAALANALVLVFACGAILWEASTRLFAQANAALYCCDGRDRRRPDQWRNSVTLSARAQGRRERPRAPYLRMLADAGVSAAVVVAGVAIWATQWFWIDPAISVAVVLLILWGTWGLLRRSRSISHWTQRRRIST